MKKVPFISVLCATALLCGCGVDAPSSSVKEKAAGEIASDVTTASTEETTSTTVTTTSTAETTSSIVTTTATAKETSSSVTTTATAKETSSPVTTAAPAKETSSPVTTAAPAKETSSPVTTAAVKETSSPVTTAAVKETSSPVTTAAAKAETKKPASSVKKDKLTVDDIRSTGASVECKEGVLSIKGNLVDFKIENKEDALKVLASVSDIIGCKDINNEIRFYKSSSNSKDVSYSFHQYYKGIRTNTYILVYVNSKTKELRELYCEYYPEFKIDLTPTFSVEQVKEYLALPPEKRDVKFTWDKYEEPELIISSFVGDIRLGWMIRFIDGEVSYMVLDAHTGECIMCSYPEDV